MTFTPDQVVDAGTLDEHGQRLTEINDVWLPLARVAIKLENCRVEGAKLGAALKEIARDPIIREPLARSEMLPSDFASRA